MASSLRTALAVPLAGSDGKPVGMVQLDSRASKEGFTAVELDLLAALAVPMGVAVENHTLLKKTCVLGRGRSRSSALCCRKEGPTSRVTRSGSVTGRSRRSVAISTTTSPSSRQGLRKVVRARWVVVVGDVAGKGMPAALMMAGTCPEVRHLVRAGIAPEEVLTKVNREVCDAEFDCRFVTLVLAELEPAIAPFDRRQRRSYASADPPIGRHDRGARPERSPARRWASTPTKSIDRSPFLSNRATSWFSTPTE